MVNAQDIYNKVRESGIFHKGGLKGKKLAKTGPIDFQVWSISDLDSLIWQLVESIGGFSQEIRLEPFQDELNNRIDSLLEAFDRASPVLYGFGKVNEGHLQEIREKIGKWINKAKAGISNHDIHIPVLIADPGNPLFYCAPDKKIENDIAYTLIKYIPDNVPDLTVAHRVNDLLVTFGKPQAKIETLRKIIGDYRHHPNEKLDPEHEKLLKKGIDHVKKYHEKMAKKVGDDKDKE
jgi:hypothetical protein